MPVSPAFQLALEIYNLDHDPTAARREIWEILRPCMDAVANRYIERLAVHTPFYRELATTKKETLKQQISRFTQALFAKPFDEQWVADTKERVELEIQLALDMRNRCVISHVILAELCVQLSKRYRFSAAKALRLMEIAIGVLLLDTTNAVALHYNAAVREAKGRSGQLNSAVQCFSQAVAGVRHAVTSAVAALSATSNQLTGLADSAAGDANKAAAAADSAALSVDQMAAATEEMMTSISEIRRQASTSAAMAHQAVDNVNRANMTICSLSESVGKIDSVTGLISTIAEQTNLLALNATIEAARAGQAGRGFAVVANEVKALATQTSSATKEIGEQITSIKQTTLHSVEEIAGTGRVIGDIADMAESVAVAVDEQTTATSSIAQGISGAAGSASTVAIALKTVAETIRQTQALAASVLESSRQISERTHEIDVAVDNLLKTASMQNRFDKIADLNKEVAR